MNSDVLLMVDGFSIPAFFPKDAAIVQIDVRGDSMAQCSMMKGMKDMDKK